MTNLTRMKLRTVSEPPAERASAAEAAEKPGPPERLVAAESTRLTLSDDAIRIAAKIRTSVEESERVIVFTGADEKDGVSTVAAQVGLALAQAARGPVLLLDANADAPSAHELFEVSSRPGLYDLVEGEATLAEAIQPTLTQHLSVLPAGHKSSDDRSRQSPARYALLMSELRRQFRYIIIDSPPILRSADSIFVVEQSDAVVIVIAAGKHAKSEVVRVKQELEGLRAKILGLVLYEA
jgi:succinoglycan biosynthesis transport protein ExoP